MSDAPRPPTPVSDDNDISALKAMLEQPDWQYVDFAGERERIAALQRWPLLAEIAQLLPRQEPTP
ncbi:cellulose biosynthesis protein BcsR [Sinimarinibacterium sp. NLF-5-8]|uniref:cellulose biosynthesis protein BcsR n=1 Tax=Sinimarinibacterium sp. NLF-5-8 TaxID=2698684 RepID=UPI00137BB4C7|nr:cellulose biosynthesis protein BcsR [Sinimarinibacterium sp. NLF-5-8]QHS08825.1 hypothetical protein GT972_00835 [Sinimarinibacterium sp. NLF-5-8]